MVAYPPLPATYSDPNLTASRFLKNPAFVARRLQTLAERRYVGNLLLPGRQDTNAGAIGYENVEGIFADSAPLVVKPGSEYSLTTIGDGTASLANVVKWGTDTYVTDEAIARRNMDPVDKALLKLANSAALAIDTAVVAAIVTAVTATAGATAVWSGSSAAVLRDILLASAAIRGANLGYEPDTLLIGDTTWAYLASDPVTAGLMARETTSNTVDTGRFTHLAGLQVIHAPAANMPSGVGTAAWVFDSGQLGFIATENLGGGYNSAGGLVETKSIREDLTDSWRLRARSNFVPVVTDPLAGYKISGVNA